MLITFSGLDGAGKSTLIEWLRDTLERQNHSVTVYHMNDHVGIYAYLRSVRDGMLRLLGKPRHASRGGAESSRVRVRNAVLWNKPLRRCVYPLDLLIFCVYRLYVEGVRGQILIMDRYFYDSLVDVSDDRSWGWLRVLERLTPTPSVPILLEVGPEEACARKSEYPLEYMRRRWEAYRTVFPWVRNSLVLPNKDLHATQRVLEKVVRERMHAS